ncbi:MAG TPA: FtsX-like permease family protein [Paucimonas sp.]|nr:FtsX-like permease family protein [Paucimonas sp.]
MLLQSLRMTWRDWRSGELRFLIVALIVAVAALTSVGFFADRMRAALNRDAHQLLGADVVVGADQPLDPAWRQEAQRLGLTLAETVSFPSMAIAGEGEQSVARLAAIKAVSPGYPLRGRVKIATRQDGEAGAAPDIPAAGTVWVDPDLLGALDLRVGGELRLGDKTFRVAALIAAEPDRGANFMSLAPRVMLPLSDLPATQLVQNGSRVTYRLLAAGKPERSAAFARWGEKRIEKENLRGIRLESLESGRPEMRATLDRAERFLSLVSLMSAMLAAVAVAMAARRFMLRHIDACAMLRCLGLRQRDVAALYLSEFLLVGLAGSGLGVVLGYASHFVLLEWLGSLVGADLPAPGIAPVWQGLATGMILLLGFALPPVLQLANVPHNRVIRREQTPPKPLAATTYGLGLAAFIGLLLWQAGDLKLGMLTAAGFGGGLALFALVAWLCLKLGPAMRRMLSGARWPSWHFALGALQRRPGAVVAQTVALALGLMALLLLTVIRGELIDAWRQSTPPDAPNRFVINIQPDQKEEIETRLKQVGVAAPQLYPMIRGRLVQVNERRITVDSYAEDRAKRLVDREFNLSAMSGMPPQNQIASGRWLDNRKPEASVEEGLAKTLGLKLGDRLVFDVAGQRVAAPITSLRKLDWGSMRVNFFVILNPSLMEDAPQTWITAFHLPEEQRDFANRLARDFPNLTIVDVGGMLRQVQNVIDQVVTAVEFLFLFALAAGVLVLYAALVATQAERTREAALMRALGATRKQLSRAQWIEFSLVGALAGMLAASGAAAVGAVLARQVFNFEWIFHPAAWIAGITVGVACALLGGWIGLRNVLSAPPLQSLREA